MATGIGVYNGMFEQSVLLPTRRNPWSMACSLLLQCSFVGALLLMSLLHVDKLGFDALKPPPLRVPLPAAKLDAVEIIAAVRSGVSRSTQAIFQPHPFTAPSHIPQEIAFVDDVGLLPPAIGSMGPPSGDHIVGAINFDTAVAKPTPAPPPVPPKPQPVQVKDVAPTAITSVLAEALLVHKVIPPYPPIAKQMRISGKVRLMGVISTSGRIEKLEVLEGHPLLVQAALDAVKQWIYRPTILNGQAVPVSAPIDVNFVLN